MSRFTRVRLHPLGPFHFGGRGVGMERSDITLSADSLFSALCVTIAQHRGPRAVQSLLDLFRDATTPAEIPFRLTSLMPYAADVFFLPHPRLSTARLLGIDDLRQRKRFKKVRWLSEPVFRALVQGHPPMDAVDTNDSPVSIHQGEVWLTHAEREQLMAFVGYDQENKREAPLLWRIGTRPRVTVDRQTHASAVYAVGATYFNRSQEKDAGLYTVIEWLSADEDLQTMIMETFKNLGDAGIGGERSDGFGQFEPEFETLTAWNPGAAAGGFFTTLAPYHPRIDEKTVIGGHARYHILLRRGWLNLDGYQNLRRSTVRMIGEGSILHWPPESAPLGDMVDVTPTRLRQETDVTIFRYGFAFPVRVADEAVIHNEEERHAET
jgi:CRISPR-associated protein Csm4